tara:strand:+ start:940 stop:1074 length:135 start_codon:yes stop_codon:yes gene_type:complete
VTAGGHSETILKKERKISGGDGMVLEDIKNENLKAYGHDHHTEV